MRQRKVRGGRKEGGICEKEKHVCHESLLRRERLGSGEKREEKYKEKELLWLQERKQGREENKLRR